MTPEAMAYLHKVCKDHEHAAAASGGMSKLADAIHSLMIENQALRHAIETMQSSNDIQDKYVDGEDKK